MAQPSRARSMWADEGFEEIQHWTMQTAIARHIIYHQTGPREDMFCMRFCSDSKCNSILYLPSSTWDNRAGGWVCPHCNGILQEVLVNKLDNRWTNWHINELFLVMAFDDVYNNEQWKQFTEEINKGRYYRAFYHFSKYNFDLPIGRHESSYGSFLTRQDIRKMCKKRIFQIKKKGSTNDCPQKCIMAAKTLMAFTRFDWLAINESSYMSIFVNQWINRALVAGSHHLWVQYAIEEVVEERKEKKINTKEMKKRYKLMKTILEATDPRP